MKKLFIAGLFLLLPSLLFSQTNPKLDIYKMIDVDSPVPDSTYLLDIIKYIEDTLFFGGGKLTNAQYVGNPKGVGLFKDGMDLGMQMGLILSNGYVGTTILVDNGNNKTGAQGIPMHDSLGPYIAVPNGPPVLRDDDMDWLAGVFTPSDPKPDTAVDPSVITFKYKPFYNSIKLEYVFASEEYKYQQPVFPPPPPPPVDIDLTGAEVSDFMAIFTKRSPGAQIYDDIASMIGRDGTPSWIPVCVTTLNHTTPPGYYNPNYDKSFIFDGFSTPRQIFPFVTEGTDVVPCQTYWIKIAVADYPNGIVQSGYNLSHQINSAVFLKAYSLMSGYGLEWEVSSAIDNNDFASDTSLVEGGCSNLGVTIKFNTMPRDTSFLRIRIDNAVMSEYIVTPPLFQDSLIMIPDSIMEYNFTIEAVDDNTNEGTAGVEPWFIRYQIDPCDVPTEDTGGFGTGTMGYSGLIKVKVKDYNPFVNKAKSYGPVPPNVYFCGNDITVNIADILEGGIPPFTYSWANPPQIGNSEFFTTTIKDSPDQAICTIFDRCTGKPGYIAGKDTVHIFSTLECQASPDFQLCQNGQSEIKVQCPYVGHDYTTTWYFQGNPVGNDSIYIVTWDDYGGYAPNTISFTCEVMDECGNTDSDVVQATFFPVVEINGAPLVCLGYPIDLTCTNAQSYQWHEGSLTGPIIGTSQDLTYIAPPPGNADHTVCVSIINECGEQADTCFTFFVSEMIADMKMNNSTNFNTCPNVEFILEEMNAFDGWQWSWFDNGTNHTATGKVINLSLVDAGPCDVTVISHNINFCYDTITRTINVYPYAYPQASTSLPSVCIGYPAQISIVPTGPVSIEEYLWTATPPDPSLAGQQDDPSPTVFPHVTTIYKCRITDNHGCLDSATVTVIARPRIDIQIFADPDSSCTDKPVQINFNSIVAPQPNAQYSWTFDDGVPATSIQAVPPQIIWSTPGLKTISCYVSESGCDSTFTFYFQVNPDPLAGFSATDAFGCQPVEVSFTNNSLNLENPTYLWEFGDGSTETVANPTHIYPDPGIYDVTLTVTNSTGCINTLTINDIVEVYEVPVADFEADPQAATIDNPTINFTQMVNIPFSLIRWDFGDSTNISTEPNPRHTYGAPGSYLVVMYTETEHGCWDRDTLEIGIVEDIKIFVPNAFSPNGDGLNECFSIGGTTGDIIDVFQVIIYNRWGSLVYESPVTNPDCIWDGNDMGGNPVTGDTYIFRIFGQNFRGAKKVYEGMVTVVL